MSAKRIFDVLVSIIGIIFLLPFFVIISLIIKADSKGCIFYKQSRVGKNKVNFILLKFRTMGNGSDKMGLLTVGDNDKRITHCGRWLRKYKIDELPQLFNILKGDMSFVGPRPEVSKYVELYNSNQQKVLDVKPGITDWASLKYIDENEVLATVDNPESYYINYILPYKTAMNLKYIEKHNLWIDLKIIFLTIINIFPKHRHSLNINLIEN